MSILPKVATLLAFVWSMLLPVGSEAAPIYKILDLGDLPGGLDQSSAYGLNDLGQVVGSSSATDDSAPGQR